MSISYQKQCQELFSKIMLNSYEHATISSSLYHIYSDKGSKKATFELEWPFFRSNSISNKHPIRTRWAGWYRRYRRRWRRGFPREGLCFGRWLPCGDYGVDGSWMQAEIVFISCEHTEGWWKMLTGYGCQMVIICHAHITHRAERKKSEGRRRLRAGHEDQASLVRGPGEREGPGGRDLRRLVSHPGGPRRSSISMSGTAGRGASSCTTCRSSPRASA